MSEKKLTVSEAIAEAISECDNGGVIFAALIGFVVFCVTIYYTVELIVTH